MQWLNNLLYKSTGERVMGALMNCEAYQSNKQTKELLDQKIEKEVIDLKKSIEYRINSAISNCEFKAVVYYNSHLCPKSNIKYIKKLYKEKGYKVRIFFSFEYTSSNRKMVISWKHWK
jgi:hypothetical protein